PLPGPGEVLVGGGQPGLDDAQAGADALPLGDRRRLAELAKEAVAGRGQGIDPPPGRDEPLRDVAGAVGARDDVPEVGEVPDRGREPPTSGSPPETWELTTKPRWSRTTSSTPSAAPRKSSGAVESSRSTFLAS